MKKLKVLGLVVASACMVALTSCLDGGSNNYQRMDYALVDYSTKSFCTRSDEHTTELQSH